MHNKKNAMEGIFLVREVERNSEAASFQAKTNRKFVLA